MARSPSKRGYRLTGTFLELCDCYSVCPCWIDRPPDEGRCTGAFAWMIDEGDIGGLNVAGCRVVSVSFHTGHRDTGGQEVFLYVDERASPDQFDALVPVFTGQAGGPLGELGKLMGVLRSTERAAITITNRGKHFSLTVGDRVTGDAEVLVGADGKTTELHHGRLATVLGPVAEVGTSSNLRVDLGGLGHSVEVKGRAAMRGDFHYRHGGSSK
ncbi:DUF1326 domain-containing protein [Microvirga massiliensis]|uniref:DUF1326 domain-containing protein n=1 Tax=Microvirga massiliensis TaxID=1033741 RepID=UPI00062BD853